MSRWRDAEPNGLYTSPLTAAKLDAARGSLRGDPPGEHIVGSFLGRKEQAVARTGVVGRTYELPEQLSPLHIVGVDPAELLRSVGDVDGLTLAAQLLVLEVGDIVLAGERLRGALKVSVLRLGLGPLLGGPLLLQVEHQTALGALPQAADAL